MAHNSTPATRAYARDKAETIGAAERIVRDEIRDMVLRASYHRAAPYVAIAGFLGLVGAATRVIESIAL